jgi:hypothetical protein
MLHERADSLQNELFQLLTDAYYGVGLFYKGAGLKKHPRESANNFISRQQLAYYLNYTGPIVDASVAPIFADEIKREYKGTLKFDLFLDDVDRLGTSLQEFMRRTATQAKLYGVMYVLVNNEAVIGDSLLDELDKRALPFVSGIKPVDVEHWLFDERGRMIEFTYKDVILHDEDDIKTQYYEWTTTTWAVYDENKELIRQGDNNLGRIPVVQWHSRNLAPTDVLPPSEFLSVAQTNYHLYQLCSWHTQILRDQAFNILTMPDYGQQDVTIGTNNLLTYPADATHPPAFIAPKSEPAQMLTDQIDRLIKEMYRMSGIDSVVGVESSKSGVAKQWDFERTNQRLADFAIQCEQAEQRIVDLYQAWSNESFDYVCEYPRDFSIGDVAESLANAQSALDLGFNSKTYKQEVAKNVLEAYLPNIEPDVYDAIIDELEQAFDDAEKASAMLRDNIDEGVHVDADEAGQDGQGNNQVRGAGEGSNEKGTDTEAGSGLRL